MNQDNLQRKPRIDDLPLAELADQGMSRDDVGAEISKVASAGTNIKDLTPQKKSKLIITLLRRLDKQHKLIVAHKDGSAAGQNERKIAQVESGIDLLSSELDSVIASLSERIAKSQHIIASFDQAEDKAMSTASAKKTAHEKEPLQGVQAVKDIEAGLPEVSESPAPAPAPAEAEIKTVAKTDSSNSKNTALQDLVVTVPKTAVDATPFDEKAEEDEEDEEDGVAEQLFSLSSYYSANIREGDLNAQSVPVIEVVKLSGGEVTDVQYLQDGQSYFIDVSGKRFRLARNTNAQKLQFFFNDKFLDGEIRQKLSSVGSGQALVSDRKGTNALFMPEDQVVQLNCEYHVYMLRRVFPIISPEVEVDMQLPFWKRHYRNIAFSTIFHFFALLIVGALFITPQLSKEKQAEPQFVKMDIEKLKKPKKVAVKKPKKVVEKKPEPKPVKKQPVKKKELAKQKIVNKKAPKPKAGGGNKDGGNLAKRNVKKTGLLAALGTKKGKKTGAKNALAKVSSLDAVSSLNAQSSQMKVAGLTAKVEGARMTLPSGELIDTKGTTAVLRSGGVDGEGNIALMERGSTGQGKVNAMVSADLSKSVRIQGGMSREAVKKVIDAHMEEVVYCYESALLGNPGLAGKAVFEWKILMSGQVGETSIKSTTLRSDSIHSCISSAIKTWQFPQPTGSEVVVSYPFIFDMVGF